MAVSKVVVVDGNNLIVRIDRGVAGPQGPAGTVTPEMLAILAETELAKDEAEAAAGTATTQAGIATTQAGVATTQASNASGSASTATTQAGIAVTQAGIATTQATNASNSATTASAQAGIATTQAGIATTKASEANTSAANALASETVATTQAGIATTQAGIATTQAGIATTQATNASNSAIAAAASAASFVPAGTNTQVQFNDGGAFGADTGLAFDKTAGALTVGNKTVTTSNPVLNLSQTWNAGAVTFTGFRFNVTDTASAAASNLIDLQVGGVSKIRFSAKDFGDCNFGNRALVVDSLRSGTWFLFGSNGPSMASNINLSWTTGNASGTKDVLLARDAAATLAQRNGVNAQTFRLYNTFTDASNYERGKFEWASNVLRIGTEKAGTGTARALEFQTDGVTRLTISATGVIESNVNIGINGTNQLVLGSGWSSINGSNGFPGITLTGVGGFNRLNFGGTTSSFPSLKRSTTALQARLADDSAFTNIQGKLTTEANAVAETPTATHTLTLYDASGTAYKVLAVAA